MTTATKPRVSHNKEAHRQLILTSPILKGPDVRELQESLNGLAAHYKFPWRRISVDGQYGKRTARMAHFGEWLIGLEDERLSAVRHGGRITEAVQRLLRNPEKRSRQDKEREDNRKAARQELRRRHDSLEEVAKWLLAHKGVNEQPPSSNHGPFPIDECQAWYGGSGWPWCGAVVGYGVEKIALEGKKTGTWWPHAEMIRLDAEAGRNGLEDINPILIERNCPVTFWPGGSDDDDHVGWALSDVRNGLFDTIEGNTSSAKRDSDGGILETKQRHVSEVTCAARLTLSEV